MRISSKAFTLRTSAILLASWACFAGVMAYAADPATNPVTPAAPKVPGGVDLRPKLDVGKTFRFRMVLDSKEKQTLPQDPSDPAAKPETSDASQQQDIVLKLTVKDSNAETGSTLELVYESLKMSVSNPALGDITFDSTKAVDKNDPAAAAVAEMLSSIVGTTLTISMDKDGNVTNVSGPVAATGGGAADAFTGKDVIGGLVGQIFTLKKGSPIVRVGETWTNDSVMNAAWGKTRVTTTNTLRSHSGGKALIAIKGAVNMEPSSPGQAISITIKDSKLEGNATWNTEDGMLDAMNVSQTMSIDITSPMGPTQTTSNKKTTVTRMK